jgi:hypothetical protein
MTPANIHKKNLLRLASEGSIYENVYPQNIMGRNDIQVSAMMETILSNILLSQKSAIISLYYLFFENMKGLFMLFLRIVFMCVILSLPLSIMYIFALYVQYDFDPNFMAIHACLGEGKKWNTGAVMCE